MCIRDSNTGYYKNEGTAENIQIELRDDQDATLKNGDSKTVIVDVITRNAQFPLKARAITVNGNASQGTIEALINVIYTCLLYTSEPECVINDLNLYSKNSKI